MSASDVELALRDISPDDPTGPSLANDAAYVAAHHTAEGTAERQIGGKIIPATDPDWVQLRAQSLALLARSKDLRLAVYLTLALLKIEGIPGFRDGLTVIHALLERHWEAVHPRLDPTDDLDPQERINILLPLASPGSYGDSQAIEKRLREVPLCDSNFARPTHRDIAIARGELKVAEVEGKPPMKLETVSAAFRDTPPKLLEPIAAAVTASIDHVKAINSILVERVGEVMAPDLSRLSRTLAEIAAMIKEYGGVQGASSTSQPALGAAGNPTSGVEMSAQTPNAAFSGEVRSKRDVQLSLDQICGYFDRNEPSSPIPLLLKGAQRLLKMNFIEIMQVLDADALKCLMKLSAENDTK
jgi:type VI secretion system protein ImpA